MKTIPLAEQTRAERVAALLGEVAKKRGSTPADEIPLSDFLEVDSREPYPEWEKSLRTANRRYANRPNSPDSTPGVKLCQLLTTEFSTQEGWRGILNRLAEIQLRAPVAGVAKIYKRRHNGDGDTRAHFQSLSATARAFGAPDAEALVERMMRDAGIPIEEVSRETLEREWQAAKDKADAQRRAAAAAVDRDAAAQKAQEATRAREAQAARDRAAAKAREDAARRLKEAAAREQAEQAERERRAEEERRRNAEIQPGRWRFLPDSQLAHSLSFIMQSVTELNLRAGGQCDGGALMGAMGYQIRASANGQWEYDYNTRVLTLSLSISFGNNSFSDPIMNMMMASNAMPPQFAVTQYTIFAGSKGNYRARDQQGYEHKIVKF